MPTEFQLRLYEKLKEVPIGKVTTYRDLGDSIGSRAYRAVGLAMGSNPFRSVPCHRVIRSDGSVGGFRKSLSSHEKIEMLRDEGIAISNGRVVDMENQLHRF